MFVLNLNIKERERVALAFAFFTTLIISFFVDVFLLLSLLFGVLFLIYPMIEKVRRETELELKIREFILIFAVNLMSLKNFEKALSLTLRSFGEKGEVVKEYIVEGKVGGEFKKVLDFFRDISPYGGSVEKALDYYFSYLERYLEKRLEELVNPIKVFIGFSVIVPIMVVASLPVVSFFSDIELIVFFVFAVLLPTLYFLFLFFLKYFKPMLSYRKVVYPIYPYVILILSSLLAFFIEDVLLKVFFIVVPTALSFLFIREKSYEEVPFYKYYNKLAKLSLYLSQGYSFESSLKTIGEKVFDKLPPVFKVVEIAAMRGSKEASYIAEKLSHALERANFIERKFSERLEDVVSTLSLLSSFVIPVVGAATLSFFIALTSYVRHIPDSFVQLNDVDEGFVAWSFSIFIVFAVCFSSVAAKVLKGVDLWVDRDSWKGLIVFFLTFVIGYIFTLYIINV